jgi:hypothetical protein
LLINRRLGIVAAAAAAVMGLSRVADVYTDLTIEVLRRGRHLPRCARYAISSWIGENGIILIVGGAGRVPYGPTAREPWSMSVFTSKAHVRKGAGGMLNPVTQLLQDGLHIIKTAVYDGTTAIARGYRGRAGALGSGSERFVAKDSRIADQIRTTRPAKYLVRRIRGEEEYPGESSSGDSWTSSPRAHRR